MARPLRLEFADALYHVTARGNRREMIFRDDEDRQRFLDLLGREVAQQRWLLYAYCLMGNLAGGNAGGESRPYAPVERRVYIHKPSTVVTAS